MHSVIKYRHSFWTFEGKFNAYNVYCCVLYAVWVCGKQITESIIMDYLLAFCDALQCSIYSMHRMVHDVPFTYYYHFLIKEHIHFAITMDSCRNVDVISIDDTYLNCCHAHFFSPSFYGIFPLLSFIVHSVTIHFIIFPYIFYSSSSHGLFLSKIMFLFSI